MDARGVCVGAAGGGCFVFSRDKSYGPKVSALIETTELIRES